jgi:hypothetical protein
MPHLPIDISGAVKGHFYILHTPIRELGRALRPRVIESRAEEDFGLIFAQPESDNMRGEIKICGTFERCVRIRDADIDRRT